MTLLLTGELLIGVTACSGILLASPGKMQIRLQRRATAPPLRMVTGSSEWWLDVPSSMRATWGTARPMKATGPQKAVVMAVSRPVTTSSQLRTRRMFTPRFSAYLSPSNKALSG